MVQASDKRLAVLSSRFNLRVVHSTCRHGLHLLQIENVLLRKPKQSKRYLDFYKVDWLHKSGACCEYTGIQHSSCGWDDLTTTTMDSISVQGDIMDVETYTSHVLLTHNTLQIKVTSSMSRCPRFLYSK